MAKTWMRLRGNASGRNGVGRPTRWHCHGCQKIHVGSTEKTQARDGNFYCERTYYAARDTIGVLPMTPTTTATIVYVSPFGNGAIGDGSEVQVVPNAALAFQSPSLLDRLHTAIRNARKATSALEREIWTDEAHNQLDALCDPRETCACGATFDNMTGFCFDCLERKERIGCMLAEREPGVPF